MKVNDQIIGDVACDRVHHLTDDYLIKIGKDWSGWETLYQDPRDGRYWERTYPRGEMHGGGPPALMNLSGDDAKNKYPQLFDEK